MTGRKTARRNTVQAGMADAGTATHYSYMCGCLFYLMYVGNCEVHISIPYAFQMTY